MVRERDELIARADGFDTPRGALRVTCSVGLGERLVAAITQDYVVAYPEVSLTLELTNRIVDLAGEECDVAIRTGRISDAGLHQRLAGRRTIETCASPNYLSAHPAPSSPEDLSKHRCLIGTGQAWSFLIDGMEVAYKPASWWRCNSGTAVAEAAAEGLGICQLPAFYLQPHFELGRLVPVLVDHRVAPEPVFAVCQRRSRYSPKVRTFLDLVVKRLGGGIDHA